MSVPEQREPMTRCKRRFEVKFLGGAHAFTDEQLDRAVRTASGRIVGLYGDPGTQKPSQAEKDALRDVLDALGMAAPSDPRNPHGGRTVSDLRPGRD